MEFDEYFKRKPISWCEDKFLNILCEEDDDANDGVEPQNNEKESDKDYVEGSDDEDSEYDFECSTHNLKAKWNLMKPMCCEMYEPSHELNLCWTNYAINKVYQIRFQ